MPSITGVEDDVLGPEEDMPVVLSSPSRPSFLLHLKSALPAKKMICTQLHLQVLQKYLYPCVILWPEAKEAANDPLVGFFSSL